MSLSDEVQYLLNRLDDVCISAYEENDVQAAVKTFYEKAFKHWTDTKIGIFPYQIEEWLSEIFGEALTQ